MSVLPDWKILQEVHIDPSVWEDRMEGKISFGASGYGYNLRLGTKFKRVRAEAYGVLDPKHIDEGLFESFTSEIPVVLPAHSFYLAESVERIEVPRHVVGIAVGKSSYARVGVVVNITPIEPEWRGVLTLEISNTAPLPVRLYPGEGICQVLFLEGSEECRKSYADKKGRYQNQAGLTLPRN